MIKVLPSLKLNITATSPTHNVRTAAKALEVSSNQTAYTTTAMLCKPDHEDHNEPDTEHINAGDAVQPATRANEQPGIERIKKDDIVTPDSEVNNEPVAEDNNISDTVQQPLKSTKSQTLNISTLMTLVNKSISSQTLNTSIRATL